MRVVVLYRPNSEHGRTVEEYVAQYQRQHPDKQLELLNIDSQDGQATAKLYDVVRYPAMLALSDDGALRQLWQDEHLPLMNEVDFYTDL